MAGLDRQARRTRRAMRVLRLLPAYLALGLAKHLVRLERLVRWAWRVPAGQRDVVAEREIQSDLDVLWRLTPLRDRDCLQRSLLLYRELSAAGSDPMLVTGIRRIDGRVEGHAWVVLDGRPCDAPSHVSQFEPLLTFGAHGEPVPLRASA